MTFVQLSVSDLPTIREELLEYQEGICPICARMIRRPVVDHHHIKRIKGTGRVRGVLCSTCNIFLAKIENNCTRYRISQKMLPQVLQDIALYLTKKQYPYIHPSERKNIK